MAAARTDGGTAAAVAVPVPLGVPLAVRLGVIAAVLALAVLLDRRGGGPYSERQLSALYAVGVAAFANALAVAVAGAWLSTRARAVRTWESGADGALITALVYCTGGASSLFAFLYNVWIVHGALRFGSRGAALLCAASVGGYGFLAWAPVLGWIRPLGGWAGASLDEALAGTGTHVAGFVLVAVLAHGLGRQVKRGRDELRELGEIHRRIFENVSSGLLTVDRHGQVTSFNREAERITGFSENEVRGRHIEELFHGVVGTALARGDGGSSTREEVRFRNRAGGELHLGFSSSILRDGAGEPDGAILIFQDLTRVVEMEAQLRRSERLSAVGQLAAGLAHEIRNPLGALSGALELLAASGPLSETDSRLFGIVKRETERLNRLVSEFLTYARSGPVRSEPVALSPLFEDLAKLWAGDPRREVRLEIDAPADLAVLGDSDQLGQVLWNLVLNAAESGPSDGTVHVRAFPCEDGGAAWVQVVIEDRGVGIAPDVLEHIFEPFFTTKPRGTGLGLATVHRMVEAAGGSVRVRSAPAEGTRIHVLLRRADT